MKRKKSIVYLKRDQLEPHPQNPRKELKTIGFFIPVEIDEDLVNGKSDMYAKLENLRS